MSATRKVSALVRADGAVDFPGDLGVEKNFLTGDVLQSRRIGLRRGALLRVRAVRGVLDNGGGIRRRERQLTGGKRRRRRSSAKKKPEGESVFETEPPEQSD